MPLSLGPPCLYIVGSCLNPAKAGLGFLGAVFGSPAQDRVLVNVHSDNDTLEDERVDYSGLDYIFEFGRSFSLALSSKR